MANDGGKGASESLNKNVRIISAMLTKELPKTRFPRADFDVHLNALIRKAYRVGFRKAHELVLQANENGASVPKVLRYPAKTPGVNRPQKFTVKSPRGAKKAK
jgi:hypothetical protein